MKKFISSDLGGAPIYKNDIRDVFNDEIWAAMQALMAPYNADTQGMIVSGCAITPNGGNFDIAAGIVYLNGEFMRVAAATNQSFTKYITPSAPILDSRIFENTTTHAVTEDKRAGLAGSAPGSGQYITISSLVSADTRRLRKPVVSDNNVVLKQKILQIGDWDMDANSFVLVAHGLDATKIKGAMITIIDDSSTIFGSLVGFSGSTVPGSFRWNATDFNLERTAAGPFDNTTYNQTSFNRGWITVTYAE